MVLRLICFQDDVATDLIDAAIAVVFAEHRGEMRTAHISRQLHARAKTSSRTKCSRI
jgi:hypothetical protein